MPRKTPSKQAEPANDVNVSHPWFPGIEAARIAKLVVYRLVIEDRKGQPGYGTGEIRVNLTPDGVPSGALTSEGQIANAYGPGHYSVTPKDAANRFLGASFAVSIGDASGRVPSRVADFEQDTSESELEAALSPAEKLLRMELALMRERVEDERRGFQRIIEDQRAAARAALEDVRAAHRQDLESVGKLLENINAANAQGGRGSDYQSQRLEKLEERLRTRDAEFLELALKHAKSKSGDDGWGELLKEGAPLAMKAFSDFKELQERRIALEEKKLERRKLPAPGASGEAPPLVIQGVKVPSLERLRELIARDGGLPDDVRDVFRVFSRDGMLPRAYEDLLAPFLRSDPGASGGASPEV